MMSFSEKLRAIKDPVRAVNKMLDLITASRLNGISPRFRSLDRRLTCMLDAPANASFGDLFFSDMMEVFLARSYRQVVKNKFNLLRDLFFVVLLMARCRDRVSRFSSYLVWVLILTACSWLLHFLSVLCKTCQSQLCRD